MEHELTREALPGHRERATCACGFWIEGWGPAITPHVKQHLRHAAESAPPAEPDAAALQRRLDNVIDYVRKIQTQGSFCADDLDVIVQYAGGDAARAAAAEKAE